MDNHEYQHGITWMDWQHGDLINEFNKLYDSLEKGSCALTLMKSSRIIEKYVEDHFGLEELYMQKFNFPDLKKHQTEHLGFRQRFKAFQATGLAGEMEAGKDLILLLIDWIMKHIMVTDKELAKFLAKKGVK